MEHPIESSQQTQEESKAEPSNVENLSEEKGEQSQVIVQEIQPTEQVVESETTQVIEEVKENKSESEASSPQHVAEKIENEEVPMRMRKDSEVAEAEKMALLRKIEGEQAKAMEEFKKKQVDEKAQKVAEIKKKYEEKRTAITNGEEGDIEELDHEEEVEINMIQVVMTKDLDKYKKKLQTEKMFKIAQMSE